MSSPLPHSAVHSHRNTGRVRGTVIVVPGRGESAALYERLGDRLAYDGYDVLIADIPPLDRVDAAWLRDVERPDSVADGAPVTLIGADSGAAIAALLAGAWNVDSVVLAGIGGLDGANRDRTDRVRNDHDRNDQDRIDQDRIDQDRIAERTSCVVHRARLAAEADLSAMAAQSLLPEIAQRLRETTLTIPVLAVHGDDDVITSLGDALQAYRSVSADVEIVVVDGGVHDALNDATHRTVSAEIVQFLERKGGEAIVRRPSALVGGIAA